MQVVRWCRERGIGLVLIGPEAPLVGGLADALRTGGVRCFGPGAAAAQLEGSKRFLKVRPLAAQGAIASCCARSVLQRSLAEEGAHATCAWVTCTAAVNLNPLLAAQPASAAGVGGCQEPLRWRSHL